MKIVFFGSSEFSIPILKALLSSEHSVALVITTPDRKKGRGQKIAPSVVKTFAQEKNLSVLAPEKLSAPSVVETVRQLGPDFLVIASYGKMVPESIFSLPKIAPLNVHPSLLPKHRGASPIQASILEGDQKTGVSIADVTKELDAGDLFAQVETEIGENENAFELSERLAELGSKLVLKTISQFIQNKVSRIKQNPSKESYAKKLDRDSGRIDWKNTASLIHRQVRAYYPWPSAFTFFHGKRLKILKTCRVKTQTEQNKIVPSTIIKLEHNKSIHVQTQEGVLELLRVQSEGRKEMNAFEFALGQRIKIGESFEST